MNWTAEAIRQLRTDYAWTQEKFAAVLRVNAETVRRWEQGRGAPTRPMCLHLNILHLYITGPADCKS